MSTLIGNFSASCNNIAQSKISNAFYSTSSTGSSILKLTVPGAVQSTLNLNGLINPYSMAVGPSDDIYVVNTSGTNSITKTTQANVTATIVTWVGASGYIVVDSLGNVYLRKNNDPVIAKYNSSGTLLYNLTITQSSDNRRGMAIDSSDNFYVSSNTNVSSVEYRTVYKYSSSGTLLNTTSSSTNSDLSIADETQLTVGASGVVYLTGLNFSGLAKCDTNTQVITILSTDNFRNVYNPPALSGTTLYGNGLSPFPVTSQNTSSLLKFDTLTNSYSKIDIPSNILSAQNLTTFVFSGNVYFTTENTPFYIWQYVPSSPAVTTSSSNILSASATITSTIGLRDTSGSRVVRFGTSPGVYTGSVGPTALIGDIVATDNLTSLAPSTTYYYRTEVTNPTGTTNSIEQSFTTASPAVPVVVTQSATRTTTTGTMFGTVNPNGTATTYRFNWGTTNALGTYTTGGSAGSGGVTAQFNETLTGLTPGTTYYYRIEATNVSGISLGATLTFTTLLVFSATPTVTTQSTISGQPVTFYANALGGVAPYTYLWLDGTNQSSNTKVYTVNGVQPTNSVIITDSLSQTVVAICPVVTVVTPTKIPLIEISSKEEFDRMRVFPYNYN